MFLRNNEGKLNLSKDVTMFGKGCCIQWGMGFLMQTQFTVCMFIFLHYLWAPYCMNWCLWKIRISKMRLLFQTTPRLLQRVVTLRNSIFNAKLFSCTCFLLAKKKIFLHRSLASPIRVYIYIFIYLLYGFVMPLVWNMSIFEKNHDTSWLCIYTCGFVMIFTILKQNIYFHL